MLVQSILASIPNHFLSLFKTSCSVERRIEGIMRDFLWEESGEGKKDHLIRWKVVSRPRAKGSLSLGNLLKRNVALVEK